MILKILKFFFDIRDSRISRTVQSITLLNKNFKFFENKNQLASTKVFESKKMKKNDQ
jgi:hypothetical protein